MTASHYVHGTDPLEQERLSKLNDLLNARCLDAAQLRPGEAVIDFGSGLGQLARAMSRLTGRAVVGVERSADQIKEARRLASLAGEEHLLALRQGDVFNAPLEDHEWNTFDVAHARFLLEHLRDPLEAVRTMVRAVRPGGRVILADDDFDTLRLWPEPPGFTAIWKAHNRTYDRHGNDPHVGRRLVQLLHQAGATPRLATQVFFGACAGQPEFGSFVSNLASVLEEAAADMAETGLKPEAITEAMSELRRWSTLPDATLWYSLYWAEGKRP